MGSQSNGPNFEEFVEQDGNVYGGMHPVYVEDVDGEEIENPVSIVKEQAGSTAVVHLFPGYGDFTKYAWGFAN